MPCAGFNPVTNAPAVVRTGMPAFMMLDGGLRGVQTSGVWHMLRQVTLVEVKPEAAGTRSRRRIEELRNDERNIIVLILPVELQDFIRNGTDEFASRLFGVAKKCIG